ncbi:MAG: hypothetical protein R3264_08470, partial [Anaerolineae bacterium]|nr:hypothetical protein [Anaerolineae bacterium]
NGLSQNAQTAAGAVITAGKAAGEVVIKTVGSDTGQIVVAGASQLGGAATDTVVATGKMLSKRLLPGETGQTVAGGIEIAGKVSKKVGSGLLGGLGQLGKVAADLLSDEPSSKKKPGSK